MGLLGLLMGCASESREALDDAEALLAWNADSALVVLKEVTPDEMRRKSQRARYALLLSMAMEGCDIKPETDSVARLSYDYYYEHGSEQRRMHAAYCLARVESRLGRNNEAITHYLDALRSAERLWDDGMRGYICQRISELFALNYNHDDALLYAQQAVAFLDSAGDSLAADYSRMDVARQYMASGRFEKATSMVDSLFAASRYLQDAGLQYYLRLLKADLAYSEKQFDVALQYYEQAESSGYGLPLGSMGRCVLIHQKQGNHAQAVALLDIMQRYVKSRLDSIVYYGVTNERAAMKEDYRHAFEDLVSMQDIQHRTYADILSHSSAHAVQSYLEDQYRLEQARSRSQKLLYTLIILVLGGILFISMWILRNRKRQIDSEMSKVEDMTRDIQLLKSSKEQTDLIIAAFVQDKVRTMRNLSETYFSWSDKAVSKREEKEGNATKEEIIAQFQGELRALRHDEQFLPYIESTLDQTHHGVLQRLRTEYAGVLRYDEEDFQILGLFFAGFSNKSVGFIMNMTDEAVRSRKKRYKKAFLSMPEKVGEEYVKLLMHDRD